MSWAFQNRDRQGAFFVAPSPAKTQDGNSRAGFHRLVFKQTIGGGNPAQGLLSRILFLCYPDIQSREEVDAQYQGGDQAAHDNDCERPLRI